MCGARNRIQTGVLALTSSANYLPVLLGTLPPLPGSLEARTVPRSPVRPQGLTEPGMKPVAVKSDCIKERGSLPSTVSHCCPLASLCNY